MKDNKKYELLSDLVKLIEKYGLDTFKDLSSEIFNYSFSERYRDRLKSRGKIDRNILTKDNKRSSNIQRIDFRSTLSSIAIIETEKGMLLLDLYDGLKSKALLPTLKEMQSFVLDNGLPLLKATSRDKAIIPFVKAFIPMPFLKAREYIERIQPKASLDKRLEGWSNIILGDKNKDEVSNM
jgi:hypothetical protein